MTPVAMRRRSICLDWKGELLFVKLFAVGTFCSVRYSDYLQGYEPV